MRKFCGALIALSVITLSVDADAQGVPGATTFTARVNVDGAPANGNFDFTLALFDAAAGGDKVWEETHTGVTVEDGIAFLSMGSLTTLDATVFDGSAGIRLDGDFPSAAGGALDSAFRAVLPARNHHLLLIRR